LEVVPAIADLTRISSDEGVERRMEELELGVSEALGISLLEVQDRYFQDSGDEEDRDLESEHEHVRWLDS
jgi:hypothetical protein